MKTHSTTRYICLLGIVVSYLFTAAEGLDCYQCSNSDEDSCKATTTCSAGQVCSNKVFQRYTLTTVYDKGCMLRGDCYSLQGLNTDRYCSVTPSTCTYCCGSNLCNAADSMTAAFRTTQQQQRQGFHVFIYSFLSVGFYLSLRRWE